MLVNSSTVAMGDGAHCKITGMGNIIMKMFDGVFRTLSNVRHVLDIEKNLISLVL